MQNIDFLSLHPQIYVAGNKRARNKLGGFLSLINILVMIAVFIFYFIRYFSGNDFNVKFYSENRLSSMSSDETEELFSKNIEIYFAVDYYDIGDCKIHPFLGDDDDFYDDSNITKCNENFEIDPEGIIYCFNFSLNSQFYLGISGNCTNEDGDPYEIFPLKLTTFSKINHKKEYPFETVEKNINQMIGSTYSVFTLKNSLISEYLQFTPVLYKSKKIFSQESYRFKEIYFSDIETISYNDINIEKNIKNETINFIYSIMANLKINSDVYEREYITLMDTLSKIGGLFSPLKLFLSFLIHFYSSYENNYQIVKNLILKKNIYRNIIKSNLNIKNIKADKNFELNIEKQLFEKKNKINSCLHYLGIIFKCCCKKEKTMRILNLCNEFVREYMSAENLIFNSILFEKFYEENPIRNIQQIEGLNEIEKEIYNYNDENELLIINDYT